MVLCGSILSEVTKELAAVNTYVPLMLSLDYITFYCMFMICRTFLLQLHPVNLSFYIRYSPGGFGGTYG